MKKTAVAMMVAVMVIGSLTVPVMAHGHGGCHHSGSGNSRQTGVYCVYHDKMHKSMTACKKYCQKHQKTHKNGKRHAVRHHGG